MTPARGPEIISPSRPGPLDTAAGGPSLVIRAPLASSTLSRSL
jgi:hypothetical protein